LVAGDTNGAADVFVHDRGTTDTTPPTAPGNLVATAVSSNQINLSWTASTDDVGVTGYRVDRCQGAGCTSFTQIATPTATTYSDTGLAPSTSYSYQVTAVDAAGNASTASAPGKASTSADTTSPSAPTGLTATAGSATAITLSWTASTDDVGVTGYQVDRCTGAECSTFTEVATPTATTYSDTGLAPSTSYSYQVRAEDAAGNVSAASPLASATTSADTPPPPAPAKSAVTAGSATPITLTWTASTDDVGVTGYQVERCPGAECTTFTPVATPPGTTYSDTGLSPSTSYTYQVRAVDAAGNVSTASATATASTPTDTTAPRAPAQLTGTPASATQIRLTWTASRDAAGVAGVIVHDRQTGTTERVSVDSAGTQANGDSTEVALSADGRFVAFISVAPDLVTGDTNGVADVFVHDRQTGTTERVSVDSAGTQANGASTGVALSADGRFVAFTSVAPDLVTGDTNGAADVFVHDRQTGTTERVSVDSAGTQANGASFGGAMSADGRYVAFTSAAPDLVAGDTNGAMDVFVHDRQTGTTERVSVDSAGNQVNGSSFGGALSADGRFVAFTSA